jgi:DNA-binding transcriptional MerR regulator
MYNIGAVARMTNITEATLRVWERRYDFPHAARTSGGHRLYSQHDIGRLQWVKAHIDAGMQASHAIRALQQAEADGTFEPALHTVPDVPVLMSPTTTEVNSLGRVYRHLLDAYMRHDLEGATTLITTAQNLYPLEELTLKVIGPALHEIGAAWERGEVDVATEHFATHHLRSILITRMRVGPPTYAVKPLLLACAPGELHEGSLLMLGVLLRRLRWPVLYLGQTTPYAELAFFVEEMRPSILVFVAMVQESAISLLGLSRWLPQAAENGGKSSPLICYGGLAFVQHPELRTEMRALYLGDTIEEGIELLDRKMRELNRHML